MPKTRRIAPSIIRKRWNGPLVKMQKKIKGGLPEKYVLVLRTLSIQGQGGGSVKNSFHCCIEGGGGEGGRGVKDGRDDIRKKKTFLSERSNSYFFRPPLVFLPHTDSFILLLHLLHLGQKDY